MIAIPDFSAGAMENWGLVTYRETLILVDPANSSQSSKQLVMIYLQAYQLSYPIMAFPYGPQCHIQKYHFSCIVMYCIVLYFNDAGGQCGVSRDCAPVVREPCHPGVVDTSLA